MRIPPLTMYMIAPLQMFASFCSPLSLSPTSFVSVRCVRFFPSLSKFVSTVFHSCTKNAQVYQQIPIVATLKLGSHLLFTLLVCIVWFSMRNKNNIDRHHISKVRMPGISLSLYLPLALSRSVPLSIYLHDLAFLQSSRVKITHTFNKKDRRKLRKCNTKTVKVWVSNA